MIAVVCGGFVEFKACVANKGVAECPLVDKLYYVSFFICHFSAVKATDMFRSVII